ncbi:MAG: hypothetical protein HQL42_02800 [Alphaproteobacteria bacterium]|nr:hypothetical protein [Alphaproteobacteria bacterium]
MMQGQRAVTMALGLSSFLSIRAGTVVVLVVAAAVNWLSWAGVSVLYQPDSGGYVFAGLSLARRSAEAFFQGISLNRVPGYQGLVGLCFVLFGAVGLKALILIQHVMMVGIALAIKKTGDILDSSGGLGLVAGLLTALSLQLTGYTNMVMSEVPNAFLVSAGLYFTVRHVVHGDGRSFLWGILILSLATMVRPAGKLLAYLLIAVPLIRVVLPHWRFFVPDVARGRAGNLRLAALGLLINAAATLPWSYYNWRTYDHFGLTGTLGLNLYSNTIEFAGIIDESSPAIAQVRDVWDRYQRQRAERGLPPADADGWRVHMSILGAFQQVTGQNTAQVDVVLMRAAVDAIKLHPGAYVAHAFRNMYKDVAWYDPAYLYQPGIVEDESKPERFGHSMSLDRISEVRRNIETMVRQMGYDDIWVGFDPPSRWSELYGHLTGIYTRVIVNGHRMTIMLALGVLAATASMARTRSAGWLVVFALVGYTVVVAGFVVPASPRHRLAADPTLTLLHAAAVIAAIRMFIAAAIATVTERGLLQAVGRLPWFGPIDETRRRRLKALGWTLLVAYIIAATAYMGGKTWLLALVLALVVFLL